MSFTAKIQADVSSFQKGMKDAIASSNDAQKQISSKLKSLSTSFLKIGGVMSAFSATVGATAVGLVKLSTSAGDASAEFNNLSASSAMTTDFLQEMGHVADQQNSSFEGFAGTVEAFQRRLKGVTDEGDRTVDVLKSIGVAVSDSNGVMRTADDVYLDTLTSLASLEDGLEKTALGTQLFGRRWQDASLLISGGADNIANLRQEAHDMGLVLSTELLTASDDFSTAMGIVGKRFEMLKTRLGAELAPLLIDTVLPLLNDKIIPAFNNMADKVGNVISWFTNLSSSTKNTIIVMGGIATAIGPVMLGLGGLLKILPLIGAGFTALTGPIGLTVTAIAGATALIISNWDKIKAYFTTGGGAETFNSILTLANLLKSGLTTAFNSIKSVIEPIWQSISEFITKYWEGSLSTVVAVFGHAIDVITSIINSFAGLLQRDDAKLEESFINIFVSAFKIIERVVRQGVALISDVLAGFLKLVKLDKWADGVQKFADKVRPPIKEVAETIKELGNETETSTNKVVSGFTAIGEAVDALDTRGIRELVMSTNKELEETNVKLHQLRTGILVVDNMRQVIEETEQKAMELTNTLGLLTGDREYNLKLKINGQDAVKGSELFNISPTITPTLDMSALQNAMGDLSSGISVLFVEVGAMANEAITDMMGGMADAIVNGTNVLDAVGTSLLGSLGSIMVELGQMVLTAGIGIEAVKKSMIALVGTPAILAGGALIAIGSLFSAGSRKLGSSMGSGAGGGYSSGASMAKAQPILGASEYRGAYKDDINMRFTIQGTDLVAVSNLQEMRKSRL